MQVSLKQSELTAAVRQYIAKQGINLVGKDVDVKFSATRGDAGIMATIDIEDNDMPELTPNVRPALAVVEARQGLAAIATQPVEQSPFVADTVGTEAGNDAAAEEAPAKKSTLFS